MKKLFIILIIFMLTVNLHSQERIFYDPAGNPITLPGLRSSDGTSHEEISEETASGNEVSEGGEENAGEDAEEGEEGKKSRRIKNRRVEFGLVNLSFGLANNFVGLKDIFQENVMLDFQKVDKGFNLAFDLNLRPLFFNINIKDKWGIGMDIANITTYGNINLAGNLLQFKRSDGEGFGLGAAAFVDVGFPGFFYINNVWEDRKLKIKIRPAGFVTALYTKPEMEYSFMDVVGDNGKMGTVITIDMIAKIYTPFSLENIMDSLDVGSAIGVDFSLGAEYPLFSWIDLGVEIINIPIFPSRLKQYMELSERIAVDSGSLDLTSLLGGGGFPDDFLSLPDGFDLTYASGDSVRFVRPFKMVFWANYRPFNTPLFSLIPVLGFSVNPLFVRKGSVEAAVKVRCDINNLFITTLGFSYEDQMWKNSLDFILNFRAFELDLGVALQSQSFVKSWLGTGLRLNFGMKFGW